MIAGSLTDTTRYTSAITTRHGQMAAATCGPRGYRFTHAIPHYVYINTTGSLWIFPWYGSYSVIRPVILPVTVTRVLHYISNNIVYRSLPPWHDASRLFVRLADIPSGKRVRSSTSDDLNCRALDSIEVLLGDRYSLLSLPASRLSDTAQHRAVFRRKLKTFLFKQ